jgi:hypothetical protein
MIRIDITYDALILSESLILPYKAL